MKFEKAGYSEYECIAYVLFLCHQIEVVEGGEIKTMSSIWFNASCILGLISLF